VIDFDDFEFASSTDVGVRRSHNQDAFALLPASDGAQFRNRGHLVMVADGMGAHAVGELASKLAADSIPHIYSKHAQDGVIPALKRAFVEANQNIHSRGQANPEFHGMGTTGTALVLRPDGAFLGHVGDSRAYRVRGGMLEQLSFDHSLVWELAKRQRRNPDELSGVPSNVIIRSLGPEATVLVDVEGPHPLEPGDIFILCSDGLSGPVNDREIGAVSSALAPDEACKFLIHLANLQGGPDNITAIVVKVRGDSAPSTDRPIAASPWTPESPFSWLVDTLKVFPWSFIALILGILMAGVAIFLAATETAGEFTAFVVAGVLLVSGLIGLMLQTFRDRNAPAPSARRRLHVYRQIPCTIDQSFVDRLDQALQTLRLRVAENHWEFDNAAFDLHDANARSSATKADWLDAFREKCRAMMILMDAVQQHRNKEEAFRPLWDKAPGASG
jgi:serine/threonine protein phosphatase PrpC